MSIEDTDDVRANIQRLTAVWLRLTNDRREAWLELGLDIETLGPNGLEILLLLGKRLHDGAAAYKADFDDDRDMLTEIVPEHADALVYLLAHSIRMKKNSDRAKARTNARA